MTQIPESSVQKLEDRLNNNGCINFCRDKAFPLAATSNKQCVCLNSLPTTLLAISTDGDAASGPSSSCNIKCPGDAGDSCFRTSCCGGPEQAYSIYATGGEWCVIQLKITPRRSRRVVKKISTTLKNVVQEVVRGEGLNFLFTVRSEDIDIITFAIAFCSWAILDELKHLAPWIMIVSLRQCANILVLMIFRSPSDMGSKHSPKKKSKYRLSFCNLVDFVINKSINLLYIIAQPVIMRSSKSHYSGQPLANVPSPIEQYPCGTR